MDAPAASVIVPTRNRSELLAEALESIAQQTFSDWEVIVVDDGSTPPVSLDHFTVRFGHRVRGIRHESSRGGAAGKNAGMELARGEFLAYLDDDDLYEPAYLESAIHVLRERPDIRVVFMGVSAFGQKAAASEAVYAAAMQRTLRRACGTELSPGLILFGEPLVDALVRSVPMAFQRPVVRRSEAKRIGPYREECFLWDCDWAIRAAVAGGTALLTEPLYRQRTGDQGYSTSHKRFLDGLLSGVEIMETMAARARIEPELSKWERSFREAAARGFLDLAYFYQRRRELRNAWRAWISSQKRQLSARRFTFLLRLAASALAIPRHMG
jgi:glycosyltransferase involved in cell wall biosynthesis